MAGSLRFSWSITGLNRVKFDKNWTRKMHNELDASMLDIANEGRNDIVNRYQNGVPPPNSLFTKVFDRLHRGTGNPLYKSGDLAKSVKVRPNGKLNYEIKIDDDAMTSKYPQAHSESKPYSIIAAMQETGYVIAVTEKMRRFYLAIKIESKNPDLKPLKATAIEVPARPVWGPAMAKLKPKFSKKIFDTVKSALYFQGTYKTSGKFFERGYKPFKKSSKLKYSKLKSRLNRLKRK